MTGSLVASELVAALPLPWQLADPGRRNTAVKELLPGPEQRTVALSALSACLAFQVDTAARYGDDPNWGLPDNFFEDDWFLLQASLKRSLPTLADVTRENVRDWAEKNSVVAEILDATWTTPPDEIVEAVGQVWVTFIVNGAVEELLRWLGWTARDTLDPDERAQALDLLKTVTPRLPWRQTIETIPVILSLGGSDEHDYFEQLANDPGLHEKTRAEAESKRRTARRRAGDTATAPRRRRSAPRPGHGGEQG
ncbi:hypothetical protein [Micromonospora sp. NPDC047134]|uniref:hypothetical protein n=1 Tax=Micromonospora sp. NPDC047134 TaxID=3154340 RepID=UPI0033EB55AA